jgi:hypothetical protein
MMMRCFVQVCSDSTWDRRSDGWADSNVGLLYRAHIRRKRKGTGYSVFVRHYSREQVPTKMSCLLPLTYRFMCSPVRSICRISRRSLRYSSFQVRLLELVHRACQVPCCRWH